MPSVLIPASAPTGVRARLGVVLPGVLVLLAGYAVWSAIAPPFETQWEALADEAAFLPLRLGIAVLALWLGTAAETPDRARVGFRLLGASFLFGVIANLLRLGNTGGTPLDPRVALSLAIPQGALMLGGLAVLARLRRDRGRAADWLDASGIVIAFFLIASYFIAQGNPFVASHLGARRWLFLLYLGADVLAVLLVATAWFRRPEGLSRNALGLMTLGFAVAAIADLEFDQRIQHGLWRNGGLLDATVALAFGLILIGLDVQRRLPPGPEVPRSAIRQGRHIVAPIAILLATLPVLQLAWSPNHEPGRLAFHVTGMVVLLGLVLVRQQIARGHTDALARERMTADARFRSLVQRSSDAILQVSTDHVIQWASPSAGELAGTIPSLLVGRRIGDLAHPEDRDRLAVFLANASEPSARNAALRWRLGRAERWHDVESVVTDLTADETVRSFVLNTRNVTERVRLEQQLRQAQKLEAVGRLAGGIAHDFNNILAAIITHAQLVRDDLPPDDDRAADLLEIEQTAQRGAVLTRRLLSFSRPEAGEVRAQPLSTVIRGMEPMLRRLLVSQVELKIDLASEDLWVRTADGQLEQILMNLAINARDAMPEGGVVHVRTRALLVRPGEGSELIGPGVLPGRWAELVVSDDGIGMDEETMNRLFEPFFTTKPSGLGTGLGLSTVRGIVRSLGGHVHPVSVLGSGTTMHVLLPLVPSAGPAADEIVPAAPGATSGRAVVLVVDDEVALRRAMERLLERNGYEVLGAGSAHEALQLLDAREWRVDLVVTDMVMPRMGGREFGKLLRERRADLPVLCISGHVEWEADDADEVEAPWSATRLLAKPFPFPEFLRRVQEALATATTAPAR